MTMLLFVWLVCMLLIAVVGMLSDYEYITGVQFVCMLAGVLVLGSVGMFNV
mgnify:CR=1 FL=1